MHDFSAIDMIIKTFFSSVSELGVGGSIIISIRYIMIILSF